jgi:biotin operon repressor
MSSNVEAEGGGVWISCAELARRKKVSRAAISKRVAQLADAGKIDTKRDGRSLLVELASFDRAVGETGDAVKEQAAETSAQHKTKASAPLRDAQTERAQYDARIRALDLADRQRAVLPIAGPHGIETAASAIGIALARDLDGLARYADEIAIAVSKEGVAGARRLLKEIGQAVRRQVADSLSKIAEQGTDAERDGPIETLLPE